MKRKILVADDDPDFVHVLREGLEASGFETICAYEGVRAVAMAHKEHPDLIILDWKMPTGKGATVLTNLREKSDTRRIPIIILTGVDEAGIEEEAKRLGAKAFLRKPCEFNVLLQKLHEALQWKEFEESISVG